MTIRRRRPDVEALLLSDAHPSEEVLPMAFRPGINKEEELNIKAPGCRVVEPLATKFAPRWGSTAEPAEPSTSPAPVAGNRDDEDSAAIVRSAATAIVLEIQSPGAHWRASGGDGDAIA